MIYSMTGYAAAAKELAYGALNVELRSVNHRYLDIQFRLPDDLRSIEVQLRELLAAKLTRGKVECRVTFAAAAGAQQLPGLNEALLQQLIALDTRIRVIFPAAADLGVSDILRWPGMLGTEALPVEELQTACRDLVQRALGLGRVLFLDDAPHRAAAADDAAIAMRVVQFEREQGYALAGRAA